MKNSIFSIVLFLIFTAIGVTLGIWDYKDYSKMSFDTATFFLCISMLFSMSNFSSNSANKKQLKNAKQKKFKSKYLFTWLGDEPPLDYLFFDIVGHTRVHLDFKQNLVDFKLMVREKLGEDLEDYYLLRDVLKLRLNKSFLQIIGDYSKSIFPGIVIAFTTAYFIQRANNSENTFDLYRIYIYFILFVLFIIFVLINIGFTFARERNRAEMLLLVLERIIEEDKEN
ncbi:hypothetical protein ACQKM9_03265 [Viridibacillus sp. NPDC093762]|uniref:hypothetical protein n=1 Tax=Viridibacillus sp. NPDC093762 TaxID=3390720 RepID=UPI003CFC0AC8